MRRNLRDFFRVSTASSVPELFPSEQEHVEMQERVLEDGSRARVSTLGVPGRDTGAERL